MSETLRRRLSNLLSVLLVIFLVGSVVTAPKPARARVDSLADRLKCPQCDVAIADSPAQIAQDMLTLVKERVEAGWSDQQIVDAFVAAYGSGVLLDPPLDGRTAALWATPAVALVVGVWLALGRRRRVGEDREHRAGADRELSGGGETVTSEVPARRDLDELEVQVASGEIDPGTAAQLRTTYQAELGVAPPGPPKLRRRRIWGWAVLLGSFALIGFLASQEIAPRGPEQTAGVLDPDAYSKDTLEAVIEANADHPLINGMRLALANRYFEERNYQAALPHYQEVLAAEPSDEQEAEALARIGWMVFDGNGEVELATELIDRALANQPDHSLAKFLKAQVRWCGAGEVTLAVGLFDELLGDPELPREVRSQVEQARVAAAAGEPCP